MNRFMISDETVNSVLEKIYGEKKEGVLMSDLAVLNEFSNDELDVLVKLIVDKGWLSETLSLDAAYKAYYPNHTRYVEQIKKELTDFGSYSLFGKRVTYRKMLTDVCKKTDTPFNEKASLERIENALLEKVLTDVWDKLSDAEKEELFKDGAQFCGKGGLAAGALIAAFRAGGIFSYMLALMIADMIAYIFTGRVVPIVVEMAIFRSLSILTGPIGIALAALWAAVDIAGPAYRVTIPAVIYIAALRQVHHSEYYKLKGEVSL